MTPAAGMPLFERVGSDVLVHPRGPLHGSLTPPGSKSIANRLLMCAALADGRSRLTGVPEADDVGRMIAAIQALGVDARRDPQAATLTIEGSGGRLLRDALLDIGEAGTAMRFCTALAALGQATTHIQGAARMHERPIGPLVEALNELGAQIEYTGAPGYPPLLVNGRGLRGGAIELDSSFSSQFLSAILMAAPYARQDVLIEVGANPVSRPYVAMTVACMAQFGADVLSSDGGRFVVPAWQRYAGREIDVEPDASGACYLWAAAAASGGRVRVERLSPESMQGDVRFLDVLQRMGCSVKRSASAIEVAAAPHAALRGVDENLCDLPDQAPTLAALALLATGPTRIRGVAHLKFKESDRLAALAGECRRVGARVEVFEDGLSIEPPRAHVPARIETYGDHRLAMSFSLLGLARAGVCIADAGCVRKSFPRFFETLQSLVVGG